MKKCKHCNNCKEIYKGVLRGYYKTDLLYCDKSGKLTEKDNCCKEWAKRAEKEYDLSPYRFYEVEKDIKLIEVYLEYLDKEIEKYKTPFRVLAARGD